MISVKEAQEMGKKIKEEEDKRHKKMAQIRDNELRKMGVDPKAKDNIKPKYDHPSMPDDGFATVLYIVGMVASLIFKDFWIPWIILTVVYEKFLTRHNND